MPDVLLLLKAIPLFLFLLWLIAIMVGMIKERLESYISVGTIVEIGVLSITMVFLFVAEVLTTILSLFALGYTT